MKKENEEDNTPTLFINVNLFKVNLWMLVICIGLSYFKQDYEYIRIVYNCLVTLFIYNNLIFIYVIYRSFRNL